MRVYATVRPMAFLAPNTGSGLGGRPGRRAPEEPGRRDAAKRGRDGVGLLTFRSEDRVGKLLAARLRNGLRLRMYL